MISLYFFITFYGIIISHFLVKFGQKRLINTLVFSPFGFFQFVKLIGISRFFSIFTWKDDIFIWFLLRYKRCITMPNFIALDTKTTEIWQFTSFNFDSIIDWITQGQIILHSAEWQWFVNFVCKLSYPSRFCVKSNKIWHNDTSFIS